MRSITFTRLKASFENRLGLYEIPAETKRFIWTQFNFILFTTIPGVFINTFFFRQDGKISTVAIYNAICVFGSALTMQISSQISLKKSPVFVLRVGVVIFNLFYITLLLLQDNAAKYMVVLGLLNAVASGFYWQGYNEMVKLFTHEGIFDKTVSLIGMVSSLVNLIVPSFSGLIISYGHGSLGYSIVFVLSFTFSLYTFYLTTRLGRKKIEGKSNLPGVYRYIFSNRDVLFVFLAEFFRGVKNIAFPLFLSIIFFKFIKNEALLGVNTTLCGFFATLSFLFASRRVRPHNRLKCILFSSIVSVVLFLPFFFYMNAPLLFALALANSFISAFFDNPSIGIFYSVFSKDIKDITFSQVMSAREIFFGLGRVIGLMLLIAFSGSSLLLAVFALIVNGATLATWALFHLVTKHQAAEAAK